MRDEPETPDESDERPETDAESAGNGAASDDRAKEGRPRLPVPRDGETGAERDDGPDAKREKRLPPAAGQGIVSPPQHVVQLRVATIARTLVDGLGRAAILQAVAKAQLDEAAKRTKARLAGARDPVELAALVPYVWGDKPLPVRTIDLYIARAKTMLSDEGRNVSRRREYVLALQLARLNETYMAAFKAGRYHTCLGVLREVNAMFGLHEAIKAMMLADARAKSEAEQQQNGDGAHGAGVNLKTEEGRAKALARVMQRASTSDPAVSKLFARFAQLSSIEPLAQQGLAAEAHEPQHDAPKKKRPGTNGNGRNGQHG